LLLLFFTNKKAQTKQTHVLVRLFGLRLIIAGYTFPAEAGKAQL
jgi:uncharacterized membrane protein